MKLITMWKYKVDRKYGGYSIQKRRKFLLWTWWSNEYLAANKRAALLLTFKLNYDEFTSSSNANIINGRTVGIGRASLYEDSKEEDGGNA